MNHRPWLLALALALYALGCVPRGGADEATSQAQGALERAERLLAGGRVQDAQDVLEEALAAVGEEDPDVPSLHALLGRAYVLGGTPYAALQHYEEALRRNPTSAHALRYADVLIAVARDHMQSGRAASVQVLPYLLDALEAAAQMGDADDVQDEKRAVMGEARYWMGELEEAARLLGGVDRGRLDDVRAHRCGDLLAHALYGSGRFDEAAAAFEAVGNVRGAAAAWSAARRGPETIRAYERVLRAPGLDGALIEEAVAAARYAGAQAELAGVLATLDVPDDLRAVWLTARGRLAAALGEHDDALAFLEAAADADPASAAPLYELGQVLLAGPGDDAQTKADAAAGVWLEALQRAPNDERVLAVLWDQAGRDYATAWRSPRALARSIRLQQGIVEAQPDDGLAWGNLGNTLRVAGRLEEALAAYDRAHALEGSDPVLASDRGLVLSALGRKDEALDAFLAAAALDPEYDAAWQNAARLQWRAGRDDEAAASLGKGLWSMRRAGKGAGRYRFLLERTWRTRQREALR